MPYLEHQDVDGGNVCKMDDHGLWPLACLHQEAVGDDGGGEGVGHRVLISIVGALHWSIHVAVRRVMEG